MCRGFSTRGSSTEFIQFKRRGQYGSLQQQQRQLEYLSELQFDQPQFLGLVFLRRQFFQSIRLEWQTSQRHGSHGP